METSQIATTFFSLFRGFKQNMQRELKAMDADITILHFITLKEAGNFQPCTAQALTDIMGLDKAQLSRILKELISKQLIKKKQNPEDKRSQLLFITKKGEHYLTQLNQAEERLVSRMIRHTKAKDMKQWVQLTQKMADNISALEDKTKESALQTHRQAADD